jgi:hypothetical protein
MSMIARFEKQLAQRGLKVEYQGEGKFTLTGPSHEKTPEILATCKAMKKVLLAKYDPKFIPAEANNPANTVHPQKPPVTSCESSTPAATDPILDSPLPTMEITRSVTPWETCGVCLAEVQPEQMKTLPVGMWMQMCGATHPGCPYRKSSR